MRRLIGAEKTERNRKQDDLFVGTIKKYQHLAEMDAGELAEALKMSRATVYNRLRRPEEFTLREMRLLCHTLEIPAEELSGIL